ncbi:unnamed protein product [Linum trigynum]|uniref:Uncharacterized protein n=1 Tax=Linum trigynum TaxID=586398 RepID=A0AAV2GGB9_9ROSI
MLQKIQQHIDSVLTQTISTKGDEIGRRATTSYRLWTEGDEIGRRATRLDGGRRAADSGGCEHCLGESEAWSGGLHRVAGTKFLGVGQPSCYNRPKLLIHFGFSF